MERRKPLTADPVKAREWRQRGAANYQRRQREKPLKAASRKSPRRNDAPWREECLARRGEYCRACKGNYGVLASATRIEVDHIMPRSQGGPSVVENGLPLCSAHHQAKTESRMKIDPAWLDQDQIAWLAEVAWVAWGDDGQPHGRGWRHFAPLAVDPSGGA